MNNKLKTLKDFPNYFADDDSCNSICYSEDNLKKEAIKYIKELEENNSFFESDGGDYFYSTNENVIRFIKYFFNISDKEIEELE